MTDDDLCFTPAHQLAAMIAAKTVSSVELTETILRRIDRLEPVVNARRRWTGRVRWTRPGAPTRWWRRAASWVRCTA